jgi:hypothetical protein
MGQVEQVHGDQQQHHPAAHGTGVLPQNPAQRSLALGPILRF